MSAAYENEALGRRLVGGFPAEWRPVIAPLEPRSPMAHHLPTWCVIAGPEGARHVVAIVSGWKTTIDGPAEVPNAESWTRTEEEAAALAERVRAHVEAWLRDAPSAPGVADTTFRTHAALLGAIPGEQWAISIWPKAGGVSLVRGGKLCPVHVTASRGQPPLDPAEVRARIATFDRTLAAVRELRAFAEAATAEADPPGAGAWKISIHEMPSRFDEPGMAWLSWERPDGRSVRIGTLAPGNGGVVLKVRRDARTLATIDQARAAAPWLATAARRLASTICVETLEVGKPYRVLRELRGIPPGTIFIYSGLHEVKPSGDDVYIFGSAAGDSLHLSATADTELLDHLEEWLGAG